MPRGLQPRPPPRAPKVSIEAKRAQRVIVNEICEKIISRRDEGGVSRGVEALIASSSLIHPWLTRDMVFGRRRRMKETEKKLFKQSLKKKHTSK